MSNANPIVPDPSEGGKARAKKLSPEERKQIAERAAEARWKVLRATHSGELDIAGKMIACAVLEDGLRVLSQQTFFRAIGRKGNPQYSAFPVINGRSYKLPTFLGAANLKPFISEALAASCEPILYRLPTGGRFNGHEARLLPLVCGVYLAARRAKALTRVQMPIAEECEMLTSALAQVGIDALVDEATGFQEVRDRKALQALLDRYLRQEFAAWAKRFPDEFYQSIFRLRGWEWKGMKVNRPQCVAQYTKDIVYSRLAPGILEELETRNPIIENGRRAVKHTQYLSEDVGHPALAQHLYAVMGIMRGSSSWGDFMKFLNRSYPKKGQSIQLDFGDLGPIDPEE